MGSNPTRPNNGTDESTEDTSDGTTETTIDEYNSEEPTPVAPPSGESSTAAGGAGATEGAAGAGSVVSGAPVGGESPPVKTTDSPDDESAEGPGCEVTEPEPPEEDDSEEEADDNPPETPEPEEPPEYDSAEPEPQEQEDPGEEQEEEDSEDEEDDEEPEVEEAEVVIHTDPWDTTGWGNEPDFRKLEETYGPMVSVSYDVLPPRRLEDWDTSISMPLTDDPEIPNDTTTSYRAFQASIQQGLFRSYLRRLRIAALSEGRNVEDVSVLLELADEVGLDADQLQEDMADVDADEVEHIDEVPEMDVSIGNLTHDWARNVEFGRMHGRFLGEGVKPLPAGRSVAEFVSDYEPVTTQEIEKALDTSRAKFTSDEQIDQADYDGGEFWRGR